LHEGLKGDELQIAIFTLTVKDDETWSDFKPARIPIAPTGFSDAWQAYAKEKDEGERSKSWKEIQVIFGGYLKAKQEAEAKNISDTHFLKQMKEMFDKHKLETYSKLVQERIYKYRGL